MKYLVKPTSRFQKDLKLIQKRGYNTDKLSSVIKLLADGKELPPIYKDHQLRGNWVGCRECHIEPDWLLIYRIEHDVLVLTATATGSHSDLFNK